MSTASRRKRSRNHAVQILQKPAGTIHPRVQQVGPEHLGIVSVDCAKARSQWMLADFYGKVLLPPTVVEHNQQAFDAAVTQLRQALRDHDLRDVLVAVERTGRYHRPVQRAFAAAGLETRIVPPFATKQRRQPANRGDNTDDTDLFALHRAATIGFALVQKDDSEEWYTLKLLVRPRRDRVATNAALHCHSREHLAAARPGFAACCEDFWDTACALQLFRHFASAADLHAAGLDGLGQSLRDAGVRFQRRTLTPVLTWAAQAAPADVAARQHLRLARTLDEDRTRKLQEIQALDRELAERLARTPYVLLRSFPGIKVVRAADYAGERGPRENYANSRTITGRAGLRPARYQSDQVDRANGPLVRCANRKLRAAILRSADNLVTCNHHCNVLLQHWQAEGKDPRHTRVKVALRCGRIAYQSVAGRQVCRHPCLQGRHYLLDKLSAFPRDQGTPLNEVLRDLQATIEHVPQAEYTAEAKPLQEQLPKSHEGGKRGPQLLGDLLPSVRARLGVAAVQSTTSGEPDLDEHGWAWAENAFCPHGARTGKPLIKSGALSGHTTPATAVWGHSP